MRDPLKNSYLRLIANHFRLYLSKSNKVLNLSKAFKIRNLKFPNTDFDQNLFNDKYFFTVTLASGLN